MITLRIAPVVASLSLLLAVGASAQFISKPTAASAATPDVAKRVNTNDANIVGNVREAEKIGWTLYRYETLTDLAGYVLAGQTTPAQRTMIAGSIVVPGERLWRVRYYGKTATGEVKPLWDVVFDDTNASGIAPRDTVRPFTEHELSLIRATELVEARKNPCDGTYKVLAMPAANGSLLVYQLRMSFDADRIPEGQHIRYEVSSDGTHINAQRELARRCNLLTAQTTSDSPHKRIDLTNSSDEQPTEIYVYLTLRYSIDFFMATTRSNLCWDVKNGVINTD
jgi:hypothetical protein